MKLLIRYIPVLFLSLATMGTGAAQASDTSGGFLESNLLEVTLGLAIVVSLLILLVLVVVLNVLRTFVHQQEADKRQAAIEAGEKVESEERQNFWQKISRKLTDSVPVEEEEEVLTSHEYDGIRELDNNLPPWWVYMFYISIVFAVVYFGYYHVLDMGPSSAEEYEMEMAAAQEQIEEYRATVALNIDESNVEVTEDAVLLAEGKEIFDSKCAACHAQDGGGGVGPNLTDKYWIHGGSINDIFKTIKYGIPQKGMISWQSQLTPAQMQGVSSYVLTLQDVTPKNPKEPQGEIYEPAEVEEVDNEEEESEALTMK